MGAPRGVIFEMDGVPIAHPADELRAAGASAVIDDFEGLAWPA